MIQEQVLTDVFPIHRWDDVCKLNDTGWSNMKICQRLYLRDPRDQMVRNYFGEEVAFFFHWFNFYTFFMIVPAIVAVMLLIVNLYSPEAFSICRMGYAFFMCVWSALFTKTYSQRANLRIEQW